MKNTVNPQHQALYDTIDNLKLRLDNTFMDYHIKMINIGQIEPLTQSYHSLMHQLINSQVDISRTYFLSKNELINISNILNASELWIETYSK